MRLHLVDGTYELFRAHHSKRPTRRAPDGRDVTATVGLVASLLGLLDDAEEQVTHIGVAFDHPIESWRNRRLASYKSSEGVDPTLLAQFGDVEVAVEALGVHVWSCADHEADDALAAAATRFAPEVEQVRILSPDKDLAQVVAGDRIVQVDRARGTVRDHDAVVARFGVPPASIPDLLALVGDTADGIPGLPGFGMKTVASLLAHYPTIDDIPDDPTHWQVSVRGAERLATTLAEHRSELELYRELTRLDTDLELEVGLSDLAWRGVPRQRFLEWCDRIGVEQLRERPSRWET
ncbi:MAG: 5'-3' exonuclease [Actinomycetota bacterium]